MYKVCYYPKLEEAAVLFKTFETFKEATEFSLKLPEESILEIKHYDKSSYYYGPTFRRTQ